MINIHKFLYIKWLWPFFYDFITKHSSTVITMIILQEGSDALPVTFAIAAATGLGVLAFSEVGS
jgi:hypothetical protein